MLTQDVFLYFYCWYHILWRNSLQPKNLKFFFSVFISPGWVARDRKSICPDRPSWKVSMSRPSQTEGAYVQTFARSKFFLRSSCVQNSLCPDFRAFKILYDQTLMRSKLNFVRSFVRSKTPMSRLLCVQTCLCPDFRAFKILYDQTLVRSKWKIVRSFVRSCQDYRAFKNTYVQTFVLSKLRMSRPSCVHV